MASNTFDLMTGVPMDDQGKSKTSTEKTKEVLLSEELEASYRGAWETWRTQAAEDDDFRNGAQWTAKAIRMLKSRNQFPIVVNVIHPRVELAKGLLTYNRPRFSATAREDSDRKTAFVFGSLMSYIWDISEASVHLKQAIDDYYVRGVGWLCAYVDPMADYGRGEVKIKNLDSFDVFADPNSKDIFCRDAAHILIVKTMTGEQLQRWYPDIKKFLQKAQETSGDETPNSTRTGQESQALSQTETDEYHKKYKIIDRYSSVKLPFVHVLDTTTGRESLLSGQQYSTYLAQPVAILLSKVKGEIIETDFAEVQKYMDIVAKLGSVLHFSQENPEEEPQVKPGPEADDPTAVPGSEVQVVFQTIEDLVKRRVVIPNRIIVDRVKRVFSVGGAEVLKMILPIDSYPMVPIINRHARKPMGMSDVRFVRGIQEYVNKVRSLIIAHAASSTNVKLLIPRGSVDKKQLKEEWGKAGTGVIEFDAELGQPVVAGPIALPNELYKNEAQARADIDEIFGIYPLMQGDAAQAPATYKGTIAIEEYGQRRMKSKKDDVEASLNQLAKIIIQMIQQTYTEQKVIRLVNPNNQVDSVTLNQPLYDDMTGAITGKINDITVGRYDLVVVSGSMLPSNRWALMEYYKDLWKEGLIDQYEVLKKSEVVDAEGVLERFNMIKELQAQLDQASQEIKRLSGDLQTAQRESVQDRKRVEVEKFKTKLTTAASKAEASKTIYEARLNDELKAVKDSPLAALAGEEEDLAPAGGEEDSLSLLKDMDL